MKNKNLKQMNWYNFKKMLARKRHGNAVIVYIWWRCKKSVIPCAVVSKLIVFRKFTLVISLVGFSSICKRTRWERNGRSLIKHLGCLSTVFLVGTFLLQKIPSSVPSFISVMDHVNQVPYVLLHFIISKPQPVANDFVFYVTYWCAAT